jgi:exodeoxyribonuclease VII large subunit
MIDLELLKKLEAWRRRQAEIEGVELFRILPNQTLHQIVITGAKTREALIEVKGIKERKFSKYGTDLLLILNGEKIDERSEILKKDDGTNKENREQKTSGKKQMPFSVSAYLDAINRHLFDMRGDVQGEVTQFQIRNNAVYFTIKDKEEQAVLSCFMWLNAYMLSGVELEEGLEIVVHGMPQMYKPSGRLSLNATSLELVGEGAIKKAYEKLKLKLEKEGVFAVERKKPLPHYPKKIGVITSREGAVIHDFMNNLGKWGFDIRFINSRVEGISAVRDLRQALRYFRERQKNDQIDALVLIRGGGSLESFQAFNNETIVREIISMPMPVIAGLGHHEDVPLAALAADIMVSTPTAATHRLNASWQEASHSLLLHEKNIFDRFTYEFSKTENVVGRSSRKMFDVFGEYIEYFQAAERKLYSAFESMKFSLAQNKTRIITSWEKLSQHFVREIEGTSALFDSIEKNVTLADPSRQLRLGFSIVKLKNRVIRSTKDLKKDHKVEIMLSDGQTEAMIL